MFALRIRPSARFTPVIIAVVISGWMHAGCRGSKDSEKSPVRDRPISFPVEMPPAVPEPPSSTLLLQVSENEITLTLKNEKAGTEPLWRRRVSSPGPQDDASLEAAIRNFLKTAGSECRLIVRAPSSKVRHDVVVQLINVAHSAGISRIAVNMDE